MSAVCGMLHIGSISSYSNTNSTTNIISPSCRVLPWHTDTIEPRRYYRTWKAPISIQVLVAEEYPECLR